MSGADTERRETSGSQSESESETETEIRHEPVTISVGEVWRKAREQPLDPKLFTWSAVVFTAAGFLPPFSAGSPFLGLAHLGVAGGLLLHLGGLIGLGPGRSDGFWKVYRYVGFGAAAIVAIHILGALPALGDWGIGFWLEVLSMAVHALATYRIVDARRLLPFRITR